MFQNIPECRRILQNIPGCTRIFQNIPQCSRTFRLQKYSRIFQNIPKGSRMFRFDVEQRRYLFAKFKKKRKEKNQPGFENDREELRYVKKIFFSSLPQSENELSRGTVVPTQPRTRQSDKASEASAQHVPYCTGIIIGHFQIFFLGNDLKYKLCSKAIN